MQVTARTHLQVRLQNTIFMVLLVVAIGLIAWLSTRYEIKADWTVNNRHTLSQASIKLLAELTGPVTITAYARKDNSLRTPIQDLVERYQRHKSDLNLHFVDPFTAPSLVREHGIRADGELIIDYQERTEHLRQVPPSEQELTSALQKLARPSQRLILFLEGHGERSASHFATHDLSKWVQALKDSGLQVQPLNFGQTREIPQITAVLVIASPRKQLLPGEVAMITDYVDNGGNLLWMLDPTVPLHGLEAIAAKFGLTQQPGLIVDPTSKLFGVDNPAIVSITTTGYGRHPITSGFEQYLTLFPQASGLVTEPPAEEEWEETVLLTTHPQVWSETGETEGTIEYNEDTDISGPLDLAFALARSKPQIADEPETELEASETDMVDDSQADSAADSETGTEADTQVVDSETEADAKDDEAETDVDTGNDVEIEAEDNTVIQEQRVIIVGDGDFISNAFLQLGGNLELGMNMMNWLAEDDSFIDIPTKTAVDLSFDFSPNAAIFLGAFFLFLLPLGLISTGIYIWLRRRKA
ncbi:MAG: ABC transporter [Candidatus Parabeggiatoa sp. nov. 1]|nr:MAG: ABC transporter [Gammaproteobacteria bacterium]